MQDREGTKTSTLKGRERGWKDKVQACWLSYDWSRFPARMTIHDHWSKQWFSEEGEVAAKSVPLKKQTKGSGERRRRGEAALLSKMWWELGEVEFKKKRKKDENHHMHQKASHRSPECCWLWLRRKTTTKKTKKTKQPMTRLKPKKNNIDNRRVC